MVRGIIIPPKQGGKSKHRGIPHHVQEYVSKTDGGCVLLAKDPCQTCCVRILNNNKGKSKTTDIMRTQYRWVLRGMRRRINAFLQYYR